jgi:hypothetical protein
MSYIEMHSRTFTVKEFEKSFKEINASPQDHNCVLHFPP